MNDATRRAGLRNADHSGVRDSHEKPAVPVTDAPVKESDIEMIAKCSQAFSGETILDLLLKMLCAGSSLHEVLTNVARLIEAQAPMYVNGSTEKGLALVRSCKPESAAPITKKIFSLCRYSGEPRGTAGWEKTHSCS